MTSTPQQDQVRRLVAHDLDRARNLFARELSKRSEWWDERLGTAEHNLAWLDAAKAEWLSTVSTAAVRCFDQLRALAAVDPLAQARAIVTAHLRPAEVLRPICMLDGDVPPPGIDQGLTELCDALEQQVLLELDRAALDASLRAGTHDRCVSTATQPTGPFPTSRWLNALWQAVGYCGLKAHYQEVADWISDHAPETPLPEYFGVDHPDVGLLVRQQTKVRVQFKKDLNKAKCKYRRPGNRVSAVSV